MGLAFSSNSYCTGIVIVLFKGALLLRYMLYSLKTETFKFIELIIFIRGLHLKKNCKQSFFLNKNLKQNLCPDNTFVLFPYAYLAYASHKW